MHSDNLSQQSAAGPVTADRNLRVNELQRHNRYEAVMARARSRRDLLRRLKSTPCMDCKNSYDPVCMDFDHRPGETKLFTVGRGRDRSLGSLMAEIAKCDIVCANCHRLRTYRLRDHSILCVPNDGDR